jgi:hypothetical protein
MSLHWSANFSPALVTMPGTISKAGAVASATMPAAGANINARPTTFSIFMAELLSI